MTKTGGTMTQNTRGSYIEEVIKPCPFCGGEDIRYSLKTKGTRDAQYHATMYCNSCHCYGRRTLTEKIKRDDYSGRRAIAENQTIKQEAIKAWNRRVV